jgi:hypothetical protein
MTRENEGSKKSPKSAEGGCWNQKQCTFEARSNKLIPNQYLTPLHHVCHSNHPLVNASRPLRRSTPSPFAFEPHRRFVRLSLLPFSSRFPPRRSPCSVHDLSWCSLLSSVSVLMLYRDLRQIPDTQEVFLSPDSDVSYIVEILEAVPGDSAEDIVK